MLMLTHKQHNFRNRGERETTGTAGTAVQHSTAAVQLVQQRYITVHHGTSDPCAHASVLGTTLVHQRYSRLVQRRYSLVQQT